MKYNMLLKYSSGTGDEEEAGLIHFWGRFYTAIEKLEEAKRKDDVAHESSFSLRPIMLVGKTSAQDKQLIREYFNNYGFGKASLGLEVLVRHACMLLKVTGRKL